MPHLIVIASLVRNAMPHLTTIAALTRNRAIGRNGNLLCRLKADLQAFNRVTKNHTVLMGRRTYDSIGSALPGRRNLVISRSLYHIPDALVYAPPNSLSAVVRRKRRSLSLVVGRSINSFPPFISGVNLNRNLCQPIRGYILSPYSQRSLQRGKPETIQSGCRK